MAKCKFIPAFLTILLFGCLIGCGNISIQVKMAVPEEIVVNTETLDIRNCDSNNNMVTTMAAEAPVKQEISISKQATILGTGSTVDLPLEIQDELRSQVERIYKPEYEEVVSGAEMVEFTIPGHMIHMYKIHWIQREYRSTISFQMDEQKCTTSYVYTLEFPDLEGKTVMACTA